jgi:hypothetical protein
LQNFHINRCTETNTIPICEEGLHGKHTYSDLTVTCVPSIQDFRFCISYRGKLAGCHLCNQKKKSYRRQLQSKLEMGHCFEMWRGFNSTTNPE